MISPELPLELLQDIFRIACASSHSVCIILCSVSSWARHIALSHLMSTIVVPYRTSWDSVQQDVVVLRLKEFLRDPVIRPPSSTFRRHSLVRSLWSLSESHNILSLIMMCENIGHLALKPVIAGDFLELCTWYRGYVLSEDEISRHHGLELSLLCPRSREPSFADHVSRNILKGFTRLRLWHCDFRYNVVDVSRFLRLTHVAVPYVCYLWHDLSLLTAYMDHPTLQMLVLLTPLDRLERRDRMVLKHWLRSQDTRVRILNVEFSDWQREWEEEMRGSESIWDRALKSTASIVQEHWLALTGGD